jgi:hypothetical protein
VSKPYRDIGSIREKKEYGYRQLQNCFCGLFGTTILANQKNCLTEINNTLITERIIPSSTRVQIGALSAILRTEYIFKTSASNYAQKKQLMPSTPLSSKTLYRIMAGVCVIHETTAHQITSITQNQRGLWLSSLRNNNTDTSEAMHMKDGLTTLEQVEIVKQFSDQVKILARQESAEIIRR